RRSLLRDAGEHRDGVAAARKTRRARAHLREVAERARRARAAREDDCEDDADDDHREDAGADAEHLRIGLTPPGRTLRLDPRRRGDGRTPHLLALLAARHRREE